MDYNKEHWTSYAIHMIANASLTRDFSGELGSRAAIHHNHCDQPERKKHEQQPQQGDDEPRRRTITYSIRRAPQSSTQTLIGPLQPPVLALWSHSMVTSVQEHGC